MKHLCLIMVLSMVANLEMAAQTNPSFPGIFYIKAEGAYLSVKKDGAVGLSSQPQKWSITQSNINVLYIKHLETNQYLSMTIQNGSAMGNLSLSSTGANPNDRWIWDEYFFRNIATSHAIVSIASNLTSIRGDTHLELIPASNYPEGKPPKTGVSVAAQPTPKPTGTTPEKIAATPTPPKPQTPVNTPPKATIPPPPPPKPQLWESGVVTGVIRDAAGVPLVNAYVQCGERGAYTNENGEYRISRVKEGKQYITVAKCLIPEGEQNRCIDPGAADVTGQPISPRFAEITLGPGSPQAVQNFMWDR